MREHPTSSSSAELPASVWARLFSGALPHICTGDSRCAVCMAVLEAEKERR